MNLKMKSSELAAGNILFFSSILFIFCEIIMKQT